MLFTFLVFVMMGGFGLVVRLLWENVYKWQKEKTKYVFSYLFRQKKIKMKISFKAKNKFRQIKGISLN